MFTVKIASTCDACGDNVVAVQNIYGANFAGQQISARVDLPPNWFAHNGKMYCPKHTLVIVATDVVDKVKELDQEVAEINGRSE